MSCLPAICKRMQKQGRMKTGEGNGVSGVEVWKSGRFRKFAEGS